MEIPNDEIEELKALCPGVAAAEEGGKPFFLLPLLHVGDAAQPAQTDALLCPSARDGYESRLFFSRQIKGPNPLNWNANGVRILNREWFAHSWRVHKGLRLAQMIGEHLTAFRI